MDCRTAYRCRFEDGQYDTYSIDHQIPREGYVKVMGGPMMYGIMGLFGYSKEEVASVGPKVASALEQYFEVATGQGTVTMPMSSLIAIATKKA